LNPLKTALIKNKNTLTQRYYFPPCKKIPAEAGIFVPYKSEI